MSHISVPVDAEARGKVRTWKLAMEKRWHVINGLLSQRDGEMDKLMQAFIYKGAKGRDRALLRLAQKFQKAGAMAHPVIAEDREPFALWAFMRPRAVPKGMDDKTRKVLDFIKQNDAGLLQPAVLINYITLTREYGLREGVWTLEVPVHALERLCQRDRNADIDHVLWQAHAAALGGDSDLLCQDDFVVTSISDAFWLPAGNGWFIVNLFAGGKGGKDGDTLAGAHLRARTWYHRDMVEDISRRRVLTEGPEGNRLIETLLHPMSKVRMHESSALSR